MPVTALSTDLYQLTMMAGYFQTGRHSLPATFELFTRRLPPNRKCLVAAGLEQALQYLEELRFTAEEVAWVERQPAFARVPPEFFDYLRRLRFTGDVWATAEGTPVFPYEPFLRVTAPLPEAQLVETALLSILNLQTAIASKAHRLVQAAAGRPVMEFGARRAHGTEAALYAARAAYLAGCASTSFVEAGRRFGVPVSGTMGHSWILAASSERAAFMEYAALFPNHTVLLLDTYDVATAAEIVVASGLRPSAVRLDSGDLLSGARQVRAVLDRGGLTATRIIVSGDLDEWKIRELVGAAAPIDAYAVGTALTTSEDAPAVGGVYKMVEVGEPGGVRRVMKRSVGKSTWPGAKQVWRVLKNGTAVRDVIALAEEDEIPGAVGLLQPVMRKGSVLAAPVQLAEIRAQCARALAVMPAAVTALEGDAPYPVDCSEPLQELIATI
jgi:nicotinate phosphoribosyltransferase